MYLTQLLTAYWKVAVRYSHHIPDRSVILPTKLKQWHAQAAYTNMYNNNLLLTPAVSAFSWACTNTRLTDTISALLLLNMLVHYAWVCDPHDPEGKTLLVSDLWPAYLPLMKVQYLGYARIVYCLSHRNTREIPELALFLSRHGAQIVGLLWVFPVFKITVLHQVSMPPVSTAVWAWISMC